MVLAGHRKPSGYSQETLFDQRHHRGYHGVTLFHELSGHAPAGWQFTPAMPEPLGKLPLPEPSSPLPEPQPATPPEATCPL
jgi:hypothetical protein